MDPRKILDTLKGNWKVTGLSAGLGLIFGLLIGGGGCYFAMGAIVGDQGGNEVLGNEISVGEGVESSMNGENFDENLCLDGVWVEVAGAVVAPDVYCVPAEQIMQFVIEKAGGIAEDACMTWVSRDLNLAAPVEPDSKIYIPSDTDPECGMGNAEGVASDAGGDEAGGGTPDATGRCFDGKININSAVIQILEEIPGVGPSTAQKIIDGRPYGSIEDLLNVKGIGEATLEKMKDAACL